MIVRCDAQAVDQQLSCAHPGVKTTDMARAQVAAIRALGVRRVALLTPYVEKVSVANAATLEGLPASAESA